MGFEAVRARGIIRCMHMLFFALAGFGLLAAFANVAQSQSSCLKYPSNSAPPSGYAASWDVFDAAKSLLVKTNCPASGNTLTLTVGKGDAGQYVWGTAYSYSGTWVAQTLSGTQTGGWIPGSGTATLTAPANTSTTSPFYMVGYVCTNRGSAGWKCGCENASCAAGKWQLQAYTGTGGGGGGGGNCIAEGACILPAAPADLQATLDAASCGCTVKLASGTYSGTYTYSKSCPAGNRVTLTSAAPYQAKLSGRLMVAGDGLAVTKLEVINDAKLYINGDNNRITRNKVTASTDRGPIELKGAQNNEIDRNDFLGTRAVFLGFFVNRTADEVKNTHIHHNYFNATDPTNQHIALYIGGYAAELHLDDMHAHANNLATVEYNMFENVRMAKSLHIKSNRNTVQYNYAKNAAPIDVRQGQHNIIKGNYIEGGNLGTHEEYNQFLCNRITGGSIDIFAGEGGLTKFGVYQSGTAKDTLVSGNVGKLVLGDIWGLGGKTVPDEPALRTEVRGHTGELVERFHQNSTINVDAAPVCVAPTAPPVAKSQVGVSAPCS